MNRRHFLGAWAAPAILPTLHPTLRASARTWEFLAGHAENPASPEVIAQDEDFWFEIQRAFTADRTIVNLNNGGVSPAPAMVQEAMKDHLDFSNASPVSNMWRILEPRIEIVRQRLARFLGADPEEVAVTRNASESLQICQFGFDLEPGDEVVTTDQDYPRMITTWKQIERRRGIKLVEIQLPVPAEDVGEIVARFEAAITPRTRLILMCHMINLTGQVLPVREVVAMARRRGVPVIVDGAHAFAHLDFHRDDLDCDYYGTSLHKWTFAPHGTGMLYVRRDRIRSLWPMMAADERLGDDIRKFEQIGTHPMANYLAIGEALTFNEGIGMARKEARMRYLKNYWAQRLLRHPRVKLHTSLDPRFSCGIATVEVEGIDCVKLYSHLWGHYRILTTAIIHPQFSGLRVSPSIYTTLPELDRFCDAMEQVIRDGLPA